MISKSVVRIGTAAVAVGLSLAGPQAVAAAEGDSGSDAQAVSADSGGTTKAVVTRSGRTARAAAHSKVAVASPGFKDSPAPAALATPRAAAVSVSPTPRRVSTHLGLSSTHPLAVPAATVPSAPATAPAVVVPASAVALEVPAAARSASAQAVDPLTTGIVHIIDGVRNWLSSLPANPVSDFLEGALLSLRRRLLPDPVIETPPVSPTAPTITIHNTSQQTIWVYNLTNTGDYSIPVTPWTTSPTAPPDWVGPVSIGPVSIAAGSSAPVTLSVNNGAPGSAANRIYIVTDPGFTLPVTPTSGVDPFYPPGFPAGDSFQNYSFVEYNLYPATGGNQYTIDTSYIDEWSLPIQMKFTLNGSSWTGAVDGKTYGFSDFDTVVNQLNAAGAPYSDLMWSGTNPWDPQPPSTVQRIIGPDKVWTQQSNEPASNFNMNVTGWVPTSYQNFVQSGFYQGPNQQTVYPYAYNGTQLSGTSQTNFDFWRYSVTGPSSTPYAIALRTAAILDGFPADANGVYGFFTYPNDEAAGQFTNIPTAVSLDLYVGGAGDGVSASVIPGGVWSYSSSVAPTGTGPRVKTTRGTLTGTAATDTFILNHSFQSLGTAPVVQATGNQGDIVVIDKTALGATSTSIDYVDGAWFLTNGSQSQFVYDRSTGILYYDQNPRVPGYTGVLANLSQSSLDPTNSIFVL